jgi:HAMP domain-containing protein
MNIAITIAIVLVLMALVGLFVLAFALNAINRRADALLDELEKLHHRLKALESQR